MSVFNPFSSNKAPSTAPPESEKTPSIFGKRFSTTIKRDRRSSATPTATTTAPTYKNELTAPPIEYTPTTSYSAPSPYQPLPSLPAGTNTNANGPRPFDVIHERFFGWKVTTKQLLVYFQGVMECENLTAKKLAKLSKEMEIPGAARTHFSFIPGSTPSTPVPKGYEGAGAGPGGRLYGNGTHEIFHAIRDRTKSMADDHAALARSLETQVIRQLEVLRGEIKTFIKDMENDTGRLTLAVEKERETSDRLVTDLSKQINAIQDGHTRGGNDKSHLDPYITNLYTITQLRAQINLENELHRNLLTLQRSSQTFESETILNTLNSIFESWDEHTYRAYDSIRQTQENIMSTVIKPNLVPGRHWEEFADSHPHAQNLIHPSAPLRDPQMINYPNMNSQMLIPVRRGHFSRKKRYTKMYKEAFYVLSAAGYLHEFERDITNGLNGKDGDGEAPTFSLYLPQCILGPASTLDPTRKERGSYKFFVQGREGDKVTSKGVRRSSSIRRAIHTITGGGDDDHAWSLKFRTEQEMMGWYNDILKFSSAGSSSRRAGVADAVRSAGYANETSNGHEKQRTNDSDSISNDHGSHTDDTRSAEGSRSGHKRHTSVPSTSGFAGLGAGGAYGPGYAGPGAESDRGRSRTSKTASVDYGAYGARQPPDYRSHDGHGYSDDKSLQAGARGYGHERRNRTTYSESTSRR